MAITKRLKFQEIYEFCRMNWAFDPPRVATHYSLLTKRVLVARWTPFSVSTRKAEMSADSWLVSIIKLLRF